jgi:orotate phosphoribosyltransferase
MVTIPSFTDVALMAKLSARALLNIEAVLFNAEKPFIFTSGWASPVYIDCRKIISFPRVRSMMIDFAVSVIMSQTPFEKLDSIAGGETAGIPYAAWIADHMGLPMQYVRKQPKGFGRMAQIEGWMPEGSRVLLVEDLATDGKSKIAFAETLRKAGATVEDAFSFFYYDIYKQAKPMLEEANLKLHSLVTWWDVLKVAKDEQRFDAQTLRAVEEFLNDPVSWSAGHGGQGGK